MIKSFADRETGRLWETGNSRRISPVLRQRTMDKLQMLDAAANVDNLRVPPSNRLEKTVRRPRGVLEHTHQQAISHRIPFRQWRRV
jgi:proteic killer suppression protein